ncbi:MAG: PmoA family protein [Draconibacterium sp.]|nr:PmoA family protein [Draconibacterium sp.]
MKVLSITIALFTVLSFVSCGTKSGKKVDKEKGLQVGFIEHNSEKKIDVMVDGKLFTSYRWPENVYKPVLYPIFTASGTEVTRGFPLNPKPGERADHMHQVGNWLNYGNVDTYDFWGNGHTGKRSSNGGEIIHTGVEKLAAGKGEGTMITTGSWVDPNGKELLSEKTEFHFIAKGQLRIIDRITTLKATDDTVSFKDTKEGMFAIRVARELELPDNGKMLIVDENGQAKQIEKASTEGITGNYKSSEGITGLDVWGTRAKWMDLYGNIGDEKISIVICDHPKNQSYPTYWHARGYGLFSANPLGVKDFTKGKKELNFSIPAGQSVTFRYRMVISSNAHLTDEEINALSDDFATKY